VLLAVIGPNWSQILVDRASKPDPDWVVSEIEQALTEKKTVIPVLVAGASWDDAQEALKAVNEVRPGSRIGELARINYWSVTTGVGEQAREHFEGDCKRLIESLKKK